MPPDTSYLDRMVARLMTQRACLNHAAGLVDAVAGDVLELGLGKGRTYAHLRFLFPDRRIIAFDHSLHAPAGLTPPEDCLVLGDLRETLLRTVSTRAGTVALIHADIGTGDGEGELGASDAALAQVVGQAGSVLLSPGGILVGDRNMSAVGLVRLPLPPDGLPEDIEPWPYFLFQRAL